MSVTETFGQTINEAPASGVRVAIPRSSGFADAYSQVLDTKTAMWTPGDATDMIRVVRHQLTHGSFVPRDKLISWNQAAEKLAQEYALDNRNETYGDLFHMFTWIWVLAFGIVGATFFVAFVQDRLVRAGLSEGRALKFSVSMSAIGVGAFVYAVCYAAYVVVTSTAAFLAVGM